MSTGRYLKHAQARPQFHKSGHVTVVRKPYPYASYPSPGQGGTDRYTSTPRPGSFPPPASRADSQQQQPLFASSSSSSSRDSNNWTPTPPPRRELSRSDSDGRHDNGGGSYSPDSVFTVSSGSSRSYHGGGGGGGGGGGFFGSSGEVFQDGPSTMPRSSGVRSSSSRSVLDVREDRFSDDASSSTGGVPGYQRSTSFLGTGSDDIHQGEFVKVKVGDFKDGAGAGGGGGGGGGGGERMTRNKFKSESNLLELVEAEEASLRRKEGRTDVRFDGRRWAVPSNIHIRSVTMRKSKGMFGFILNCKPISGDPLVPDAIRSFPHVESIVENSVAKFSGLRCGDFVLEIGSQSVVRGSLDRCNFLIRSSGDCLRLTVASPSYGQFKTQAPLRTFQNATAATPTTTTTGSRHPDGFSSSSRTPVGYKSFMERRCNEAKKKHACRPAPPALIRAASVPNLAAIEGDEDNRQQHQQVHVYEELNETAAPRNLPLPLPLPLRPTLPPQVLLGRSSSNASRNRNWTARHAGNGGASCRDALFKSGMGQAVDAETRRETNPVSLPSVVSQTNFLHDRGGWEIGSNVTRVSVVGGATGKEGPSDGRNSGKFDAARDEDDSTDTRTLATKSPDLSPRLLEGVGEKEFDHTGLSTPQWNKKSEQESRTVDQASVHWRISPAAMAAPATASTPPVGIQSGARFTGATHSTDGASSPGVKPSTPVVSKSPGVATATFKSSAPGRNTSFEPHTLHSPTAVATTGTTGIAKKTVQTAEVTSSDAEDDDPSPLLSAIRSHPLIVKRPTERPKSCDYSSRVRQAALLKRPAPLPLPKRKPGPPPGRGTSVVVVGGGGGTDEPSPPGGSAPSSAPSVPTSQQQTFAGKSPARPTIKAGKQKKSADPAASSKKTWNNRNDQEGGIDAPTDQHREFRRRHVTRSSGISSASDELNLTVSDRVLKLTGVTTEHSYSEEREAEGGAKEEEEEKERESKFSENVRLNFDDVTGKLIIGGATVDESEIDPVSLPPPPTLDFTTSSGTGPGQVVPSTRSDDRRNLTGRFEEPHRPTKTQFLNGTSGDDVTAFVDVASLPPPVSFFDDRPEVEPESRSRSNPDDVTGSKSFRRTESGVGSSTEVKATGTGSSNLQPPLQQGLPVLPSRDRPAGGNHHHHHHQELRKRYQTEVPGASKTPSTPSKPPSSVLGGNGGTASTTAIPSSSFSPPPPNRSVTDWSSAEVGDWLRGLGFERHCQAFVSRSVDGRRLCDLTRKDLIDLGVTEMEHRRDIERSVLRLRSQQIT